MKEVNPKLAVKVTFSLVIHLKKKKEKQVLI